MILIKRAYQAPSPEDGVRFLVDRLWPRGVKKADLQIEGWIREAASSSALRLWYGHDPQKWQEFCRRYAAELDASHAWQPLAAAARRGTITLVYASRQTELNNAEALKWYLEAHLGKR
jgi:uncharacterized protein YeaO (DUF488 family)